jgi:transposase
MNGQDDPDRLHRLPIRPRPISGETVESYVRRLARANHLRPSYLRARLTGPQRTRIQIERLAQVSDRPAANLQRALIGTPIPRPRTGNPERVSQAALVKQRRESRTRLFAAIRTDHHHEDLSIRALAARHQVHRRTITQALASSQPPPRKRQAPRPRTLRDDTRDFVDAIIGQDLQVPARRRHSVQRIWERLLDEYDVTVSYSTVRDYVIRRRTELATPNPEPDRQRLPEPPEPARRLPADIRSAFHYFTKRFADGTLAPEILHGIDYLPHRHAAGPDLEIPITIFTNILNIDENGTVTNTDAAHRRAAQWIRASCDPTYQIDPPLQPWETELP